MNPLLDNLPQQEKKRLKKRKQPKWTSPMLATLTHDTFSDKNWIFERKLDGERCLAFRSRKKVRLLSRNRKELNNQYPEIIDALLAQKNADFIVDGEIVAFEGKLTSFSKLQPRMQISDPKEVQKSGVRVYYYLFDLLYLDGYDVANLSLWRRKNLLKNLFAFSDPLRFMVHRRENGQQYHEQACEKGWEGLIAKRADAVYSHSRSRDWLKFKCVHRQEFVIGGFTEPRGSRIGFGALLVGYYQNGRLRYAGKVGTGYDDHTLKRLRKKFDPLERKSSPFSDNEISTKGVHWLAPKLVAEIGFTEWTGDGKLRHTRYLGLRRDKNPRHVVREQEK